MSSSSLPPEHSDAALVPFLEKVEQAIAARVDARLAEAKLVPVPAPAAPPVRRQRDRLPARRIIRDAVAVGGGALLVAGIVGLHGTGSRSFGPGPHGTVHYWVRNGPAPGPGAPGNIVVRPAPRTEHGFRR